LANFFEVDFLDVEAKSSGDAICVRYELNGLTYIHVVDGGYQSTGEKVVNFINKHYGSPKRIDHVVATHNDGDHAGGPQKVLEDFEVGALWMLRPWAYAAELLPWFKRFTTVDGFPNSSIKHHEPGGIMKRCRRTSGCRRPVSSSPLCW
jgi:glyoxylase-like metal-dependent hydrolase (beta-lactamase superfamily II)